MTVFLLNGSDDFGRVGFWRVTQWKPEVALRYSFLAVRSVRLEQIEHL